MARNVLFVDDDPTFLRMVEKQCLEYADSFKIHVAENGIEAVKKLRKLPFSMVFTDLQMPQMDGFSLFDHIRENFPDIPVAIVTGTGKPKTESVMMGKGAYDYLVKPVERNVLIRNIVSAVKKESEAGMLREASLEMFTQLIEMEQKTCTIRVDNRKSGQRGVLFFKNGALVNSRIGGYRGKGAAYEIFSWDRVSLSIENSCAETRRAISDDLQTVLFEAMRRKDESGAVKSVSEKPVKESVVEPEPAGVSSVPVKKQPPHREKAKQDPVENLRRKLSLALGERGEQFSLMEAEGWEGFMKHCEQMGELFDGGELKACYLSEDPSDARVVVPGEKNIVLKLNSDGIRDSLLNALS